MHWLRAVKIRRDNLDSSPILRWQANTGQSMLRVFVSRQPDNQTLEGVPGRRAVY